MSTHRTKKELMSATWMNNFIIHGDNRNTVRTGKDWFDRYMIYPWEKGSDFSEVEVKSNMSNMSDVPQKKAQIDWSSVIATAESHMEAVFNQTDGEGVNEDDDHYIFEAVLSAMYGHDIWGKYNAKMK